MRLMEDLVFSCQIDPATVEAMTVRQIHWWIRRAVAHQKRTKPGRR